VFAFQLLWNMAGFTVVGFESTDTATQSVAISAADAHATLGKGLVDQAHGLIDDLPDLPDGAAQRSTPKPAHSFAPLRPWFVLAGLPPPTLDGLLRPPQTA